MLDFAIQVDLSCQRPVNAKQHTQDLGPARTDQAGKIDLTLGLAPTPRMRSYVQLFAYRARGGTLHLRGESSLAVRLTNRLWFDTGLSTGITPDQDYQLKLGIWTEF